MITKEKQFQFQLCINCSMQNAECYCEWSDYAKEVM